MAIECPRWGEFTEFMTDHIFRHIDGDEFPSIVHGECQSNHFGGNRGPAGPSFNHFFITALYGRIDLLQQVVVNEWTFFD
jgi:hypothetical protein